MAMSVGKKGAMSEINITPLVDVVLVLLIIFMVITPILQKGFDTSVPQKAPPTGQPPPTNTIILQVGPEGSMTINKQPVEMMELGDKLGAIYSTRPDKILFVDADDKLTYEMLVKILDICKGPGKVETIGFVLN